MSADTVRKSIACLLVAALSAAAVPSRAAQATPTATVAGTVISAGHAAPVAGAVVVVRDASGNAISSEPTAADGAYAVTGIAPGVETLSLQTRDGAYAIDTPITLAPGESRTVHLAMRAESDDDKKKKKGAAAVPPSGSAIAAMVVTIVGFAGMAALAIDSSKNDQNKPPASASNPD